MTEQGFEQDLVLTELAKAVEKLAREQAFDMLIITGDISYSGKKQEFDLAETFIEEVLVKARCDQRHVFVVPGNHDVDRSKISQPEMGLFYTFNNESKLNEILSYEPARENIMKKLAEYEQFGKRLLPAGLPIGPYGEYASRCTVTKGALEYTLGIVGLNSAFFSSAARDEDKGRLAIGLSQIQFCLSKLSEETDFVLTLVHHPFTAIHDCDESSMNVIKRVSDIVAFGHRHKPNNEVVSNGMYPQYVSIGAGASFETRTSANYFNVIELDEKTNSGCVTGYMYMPLEHLWTLDTNTNKQHSGNKMPFTISKTIAASASKTPASGGRQNHGIRIEIAGDNSLLNRVFLKELKGVVERHCKTGHTRIERINNGSLVIVISSSLKPETTDLLTALESHFPDISFNSIEETECSPQGEMLRGDSEYNRLLLNFSKEHEAFLNDPGATFSHPRVDGLGRDDLFVIPTLLQIDGESKSREVLRKYLSARTAIDNVLQEDSSKQIIYGPSACGKTTLSKWLVQQLFDAGYIPILANGESLVKIDQAGLGKFLSKTFKEQYDTEYGLDQFGTSHLVIIIDDMQAVPIPKVKYRASLVRNIEKLAAHCIILGNELLQFGTYVSKEQGIRNMFEDYKKYAIAEMGPVGRYEIVTKWNALGRSDVVAPNEMLRLNKDSEEYLEQVIGKNYVPSFPVFILSVLQLREATQTSTLEYSQHGFYYEKLINDALNRSVSNREDLSLYYNYVTDYTFFLFQEKIGMAPVSLEGFSKFYEHYVKEYDVDFSERRILDTLTKAGLLEVKDGHVRVRYRYVYYFFVAKYLAGHISQPETKTRVTAMCERLHREEFANVVMFLTHLSKDAFIIDELMRVSRSLWKDIPIAKLEDDVKFMNDLVKELPMGTLREIATSDMKRELLEEEEEIKRYEDEFNADQDVQDFDLDEDTSTLDVVSEITRSLKTIDILGQISKKYWGALKADRKYDLVEEVYFLGLRTLGFYFSLIGSSPDLLLDYIKKRMRGKGRYAMDKNEIDTLSRNFLFSLGAMCSYFMVKRITQAVGHEKLKNVFADIVSANPFNSVLLVDISNRLEITPTLPFNEVIQTKEHLTGNFMAFAVLQSLVKNYLYMFPTSHEDKQRLASLLNIKIEQQRNIEATSQEKRRGLPPRRQ